MDNSSLSYLITFVAGMAAAALLIRWLAHRAIEKFMDKFESGELTPEPEVPQIKAKVEVDNGVFFVYNNENGSFIAQGNTIEELKKHLQDRYKDIDIRIVSGDPEAFAKLKLEVEKFNENSSSVRSTP